MCCTCTDADSSILAFSAASLNLWRAMLSLDKSTPLWENNTFKCWTLALLNVKFSFLYMYAIFNFTVENLALHQLQQGLYQIFRWISTLNHLWVLLFPPHNNQHQKHLMGPFNTVTTERPVSEHNTSCFRTACGVVLHVNSDNRTCTLMICTFIRLLYKAHVVWVVHLYELQLYIYLL